MAAIWNMIRHRYLGVGATVAMLVLLPLIVIGTQRHQNLSGIAEGSATISFSPLSTDKTPITKNVGEAFYLNVLVNPGKSVISIVRLDINYDPKILKLSPDNPIELNDTIFSEVVDGPHVSNGNIRVTLSVGSDLTKSVSSRSRAATINFIPISATTNGTTIVAFGANTKASSVEVNDISKEGVAFSDIPAYVKVN